ncbi:MAG: hypothetical protein ACU841_08725 [Gammaproteobacteria bacterium]
MKKSNTLLLTLCCVALMACNKGQQINGHTTRTAYKSVKILKERITSPDTRIEFEVSFWTIRDANKNDDDFLNAVDGKTPLEIIELGKEIYQQRQSSGFPGYEKYASWEEMIANYSQERTTQNTRQAAKKEDARDKANDVLYNLR